MGPAHQRGVLVQLIQNLMVLYCRNYSTFNNHYTGESLGGDQELQVACASPLGAHYGHWCQRRLNAEEMVTNEAALSDQA